MKLLLLLLLFFTIFLFRCNNNAEEKNKKNNLSKDTIIVEKNYSIINVKLYSVNPVFYPFLDTVIENEKKCPYYYQKESGFLYSKPKFFAKSSLMKPNISIYSVNIETYDYSKCYGVFEYKNHRFICDSNCNKELLNNLNKVKNIKYLSKKKEPPHFDDSRSTWYFEYKKNKIKITGYSLCLKPKN